MDILFAVLILLGFFLIYDSIRSVNKNIMEQTKEIKALREELSHRRGSIKE